MYDYEDMHGMFIARVYETAKGYRVYLPEHKLSVYVDGLSIKPTTSKEAREYKGIVKSMESWKVFSLNPKAEQLIPIVPNHIIYGLAMDAICAFIKDCPKDFEAKRAALLKGKTEQLKMSI